MGSAITLAFQQRATDRSHQFTRRETLRQERLDAYSVYAGALINYRRCLVHLWFCEHEHPPPESPDTVRIRAYDLRSNAQEALFRMQMLTDDETLSQAAEDLLADITGVRDQSPAGPPRELTRHGGGPVLLLLVARLSVRSDLSTSVGSSDARDARPGRRTCSGSSSRPSFPGRRPRPGAGPTSQLSDARVIRTPRSSESVRRFHTRRAPADARPGSPRSEARLAAPRPGVPRGSGALARPPSGRGA